MIQPPILGIGDVLVKAEIHQSQPLAIVQSDMGELVQPQDRLGVHGNVVMENDGKRGPAIMNPGWLGANGSIWALTLP